MVHAFRRDELKSFRLILQEAEPTTCYLQLAEQASNKQIEIRNNWLFIN